MITTPAVKGRMGSTNYYFTKLPASHLTGSVRPACEVSELWNNNNPEESLQREPNFKRIKEQIAPYLANNPDRFMGSILVLSLDKSLVFESIQDLGSNLNHAYKSGSEDLGFLSVDSGKLIALDGQHRLMALREIVQGNLENPGKYHNQVPEDDISVIFIEFESFEKSRGIFSVINRYAKPTSPGQNIKFDPTDGYAITMRKLVDANNPLIPVDKVNVISSALPEKSKYFTTFTALYEMTKEVVENIAGLKWPNTQLKPTNEELNEAWVIAREFLTAIFKGVDGFNKGLNSYEDCSELRVPGKPYSMIMKPIAQMAIVDALVYAISTNKITLENALTKINKINWDYDADIWENVLRKGDGKIDNGKQARKRAAAMIIYMIMAHQLDEPQQHSILRQYQHSFFKDIPSDVNKWKVPSSIN